MFLATAGPHGVEISRCTAWGSRRKILKRVEHETIPNVTPSRIITAAVPSYTRYLNPYGSLVNRRRDLIKATQPIPASELPYRVSHDPFTSDAVRRPYLSATPSPAPPFIRSNYIITLRLPPFPPIAYDSLLARVTLFARPSTTRNHLTASISVNDAWLNILALLGYTRPLMSTMSDDVQIHLSDRTDLANRVAI